MQHHILEILLTDYWTSGEASDKGLKVTAWEIRQVLRREFASRAEFRQFLDLTGERPSDERFLIEDELLLKKFDWLVSPLRGRKGPEHGKESAEVDEAYAKFGKAMKRKWILRTNCRTGYVIVICSQYGASRAK
ncbi:MAG: hypothetical protein E7812_08745 [Phenylobacterium sp.]|nr:MAG: hypothetical protein E7812_08745 [Phenylobacterium sp.]